MPEFSELGPEQPEGSVVDWFERQVEKSPDRLAVKSRKYALSYCQLNQAANRVARATLARLGPGEEPVAVLCEQDVPALVAALGVLKAGKFYLSLDPSVPHVRNAEMLSDFDGPPPRHRRSEHRPRQGADRRNTQYRCPRPGGIL